MKFIWDNEKALRNISKHGVSFEEAQTVFDDTDALQIYDPDHSEEEDRFILLGLSKKLRMLIVCHCDRSHDVATSKEIVIRIISARKASKNETSMYSQRK